MIYERFAPTLCQGSQRTFFFLVHFTCCSKPDKNLHKDNFQKTYSQSFSTTLHILRYYTIHTNVCIVHYKMWFLCKVWFPYQTALEIQRICEDIFNDINTYVFVLWYNKQEKQILYDVPYLCAFYPPWSLPRPGILPEFQFRFVTLTRPDILPAYWNLTRIINIITDSLIK